MCKNQEINPFAKLQLRCLFSFKFLKKDWKGQLNSMQSGWCLGSEGEMVKWTLF